VAPGVGMTLELLLAQFDGLIQTPADVAKLNATILQWAMQGRLVPQCVDDEPASALIERITAKKASLMKEGQLRKTKRISNVEKSEIPYFLPKGWNWCRWDHVSLLIGDVDHKMPKEIAEGIPYISPRDFANENDIIFPRYGTIGVNRFVKTHIDFLASYSCAIVKTLHDYIEPRYAFFYSLSPLVQSEIEKYTNKTTQPNVGIGSIKNFLFPLPPLAEQKRIVARVDELLGQTAVLTQQLQSVNEQRRRVHTAVLHQLTQLKRKTSEVSPSKVSSDTSDLLFRNFDRFYVDADTIAELKQAILQLAVQGRLVPQDERDEDAAVLLARIQEEKKQLEKTGKIKKPRKVVPIKEVPFLIPDNWKWVRLGNLWPQFQNGLSKRHSNEGEPTIVLRLADIIDGKVSLEDTREINLTVNERTKYELNEGDILITRVNGSVDLIGSFTPINESVNATYCDHFIRLQIDTRLVFISYITYICRSHFLRRQIEEKFINTAGQKTVNQGHISNLVLPLPPLTEQKRIVAKVDELFALCDQLAGQVTAAATSRQQLLEAVLVQAT